MHGVELCLALADVRDEPLWLDRALAIVERLIHRHAAPREYRILEHLNTTPTALTTASTPMALRRGTALSGRV